jgi:uncharacterized protein (UPF0335 family)
MIDKIIQACKAIASLDNEKKQSLSFFYPVDPEYAELKSRQYDTKIFKEIEKIIQLINNQNNTQWQSTQQTQVEQES